MEFIDKAIKGMPGNTNITVYDNIDLNNAVYVSKRGSVNFVGNDNVSNNYTNDQAYSRIQKMVEREYKGKPVILASCDATHYGFMNNNLFVYDTKYIRKNARTWIKKTNDNLKYGRYILLNHDSKDVKSIIGHVKMATPFVYNNADESDITRPSGHIELIHVITNKDAIEMYMDGALRTMSTSFSAPLSTIFCSECGKSVNDDNCDHYRGMKITDEDTKKKRIVHWRSSDMEYKEASYVTDPADTNAVVKNHTYVNLNVTGMDNVQDIDYDSVYSDSDIPTQQHEMNVLVGYDNNGDTLYKDFSNNIIDLTGVFIDSASAIPISDDTDNDNNEESTIDDGKIQNDSRQNRFATLQYVQLYVNNDWLSYKDACDILYTDCDIFISRYNKDNETIGKDINNTINDEIKSLINEDAKLSTKQRKRLPKSAFCGPDRSFPVPDCSHVTAARRLLGKYKGPGDKEKIKACIERKAKNMGCDSKDINKTNKQEDTRMEFQFKNEEELLNSDTVVRAIESVREEYDSQITDIKDSHEKEIANWKQVAIQTITDAAVKLGKPQAKEIVNAIEAKDEEKEKAARKSFADSLEKRSNDALFYQYEDYTAELGEFEKSNAENPNNIVANADTGSSTGSDANSSKTDPDTPDSHGGSDLSQTDPEPSVFDMFTN